MSGQGRGVQAPTRTGRTPAAPPQAALRAAGLRVTRPRLAVLRAVHERPHADTATLVAAVREREGAVSRQAVYDVLDALTTAGLLRRIQPAGHVARYEARVGDNHHHAVCRSCGHVTDVDCVVGEAPCLDPRDGAGYDIDEAEVVFWGSCVACGGAAAPQATGPARTAARDNVNAPHATTGQEHTT